jgi:hypothetical protein
MVITTDPSEQSWDWMTIPWLEYTMDIKVLMKPAATQSAR